MLLTMAATLTGAGRGAAAVHLVGPSTLDHYIGRHVTMTGTVLRSSGSPTFQSLWVGDLRIPGRGPLTGIAQVTARATGTEVPGSAVRVTGTVERLPGRAFDGSIGYDDRMEREGVFGAIPGAGVQRVVAPPAWSMSAMAWRLRQSMAVAVRAQVPEPEATILLGELVGIRGKLPAGVEADLVASGLVHLLAVSGLKVALVAGVLSGLLRQAGRRAALLAIAGIFAYAAIGGASSAAMRSALMGSLALLAQVLRRDVDPVRSLLLALAPMLGVNPALGGDLSFQYSFLGVAGILLLQRPLDRRLGLVPRPFREALSVSVAAQMATLPLTAAYFHVVAVMGPLANTVAVPVLPPSMAAAAWVPSRIPCPAGLAVMAAAGSAHLLVALAGAAANIPGGAVAVPWFGVPDAVAYYVAASALLAGHRLGLPAMGIGWAAALATAVLLWTSLPDGRLHLALLSTPGGGALVTAPDGARMLVDGGTSAPALAAALDAQLAPQDPRLDALVLTGSAATAAGGIGGLGPRIPALVMVPSDTPGDVPALVADALAAHGSTVRVLAPGSTLTWHGLDLTAGACGDGISLTIRLGQTRAWFCAAATRAEPGRLPDGGAAVVDIGEARVQPDGSLAPTTWVVEHTSGSSPGAVSAGALGARLWRTSKDGPLVLACDVTSCARSGSRPE